MWTATFIRRHIFSLPADQPFTTRDCLIYGVRAAVDQTLYRLVKKGTIRRLARGIFVRDERKYFSVFEIASIKAEAFGRKILKHDGAAALFIINSRSTSFRSGGKVIALQERSQRKMRLGDGKVGQAMQALWQIGEGEVNRSVIQRATDHFRSTDRVEVTTSIRWLPAWLSDFFIKPDHWPGATASRIAT
jgi:hypothetical protein